MAGLEPAWFHNRGILSPLCLPIPPHLRARLILQRFEGKFKHFVSGIPLIEYANIV